MSQNTDDFKIEEEDLYEILEIPLESTTQDIKKAYRKKALSCHPDKNPDNPNAAKLFHRLTKILELLTDEAARKAYDRVLKGRKEAALRHQRLDSQRKKLKEDLEARERQAASQKSESDKLRDEIERLRKEGSRLVQEEMEYLNKKVLEKMMQANSSQSGKDNRIKIKWKAEKKDPRNGGYSEEVLRKILCKYGPVTALVISKKGGSALVDYESHRAAEMAVELESGLVKNPLKLEWVNPPIRSNLKQNISSTIKPSDYESIVITKLRQAEERKKLIEQMMAEDENLE